MSGKWQRTRQRVREETSVITTWLLFPISSKGSFMCNIPQIPQNIPQNAHTMAFVTPVAEWENAQWVHYERLILKTLIFLDTKYNWMNERMFNDTPAWRKEGRKEGNVLFNDALHTFYLWLYGVRHTVKDHSDSEKGNPLSPISSKGSFICTIPQTG